MYCHMHVFHLLGLISFCSCRVFVKICLDFTIPVYYADTMIGYFGGSFKVDIYIYTLLEKLHDLELGEIWVYWGLRFERERLHI